MSDLFHKEYRELTQPEKQLVASVKDKATELLNLFETAKKETNGRLIALATTELETSVMWAVKAITE